MSQSTKRIVGFALVLAITAIGGCSFHDHHTTTQSPAVKTETTSAASQGDGFGAQWGGIPTRAELSSGAPMKIVAQDFEVVRSEQVVGFTRYDWRIVLENPTDKRATVELDLHARHEPTKTVVGDMNSQRYSLAPGEKRLFIGSLSAAHYKQASDIVIRCSIRAVE